jgi:anaerobic glycerol-3-phosphate dehydrogenase
MSTLLAALLDNANVTTLIVAILGGGFINGLIALLRFRVDKDAVVVTAAQGAVVVQTGVIDALQEELERLKNDVTVARTEVERLQKLYEQERSSKLLLEDQLRQSRENPDVHPKT